MEYGFIQKNKHDQISFNYKLQIFNKCSHHFLILFSFMTIPSLVAIINFEGLLYKKSACTIFPPVFEIRQLLSPLMAKLRFQITVYYPKPLTMNFQTPSLLSSNFADKNEKSLTPYVCRSCKEIYSLIGLGLFSKGIFFWKSET